MQYLRGLFVKINKMITAIVVVKIIIVSDTKISFYTYNFIRKTFKQERAN